MKDKGEEDRSREHSKQREETLVLEGDRHGDDVHRDVKGLHWSGLHWSRL